MALVEFGGRQDDEVAVPVVLCIAPDAGDRVRLLEALEHLGVVVVLAPDSLSAQHVLGRSGPLGAGRRRDVIVAGDLEIDRDRAEARWRGVPLDLTAQELGLLACVAQEPGRVWPFAGLHGSVWGNRYLGDPSCVHAAVKRLRRKLRVSGVTAQLEAVRGIGFRLVGTTSSS